ncbi:MAG: aldolase/citrate lyase family protein [Thermoanaerobaculum sp.]|nr:aldolase/citrate lyase family protein [Thermoanaerobaculum sp.]
MGANLRGEDLALFVFSTDPRFIAQADAGGVDGYVVDWEYRGKAERQEGFDTQINRHTVADLHRVREATRNRVICRIHPWGPWSVREVEEAVAGGADEILLPMVRSAEEVQRVLDLVRQRCGVGILVETVAAVAAREELAQLPLSRVFFGLQDLAVERKTPNPFRAVHDGTVEKVRAAFSVPFGFAGLTLPEGGNPIPCRLLLAELVRLRCHFTFLRRSFHRDVKDKDVTAALHRLRQAVEEAFLLPPEALAASHRQLLQAIDHAEAYFRTVNAPR